MIKVKFTRYKCVYQNKNTMDKFEVSLKKLPNEIIKILGGCYELISAIKITNVYVVPETEFEKICVDNKTTEEIIK